MEKDRILKKDFTNLQEKLRIKLSDALTHLDEVYIWGAATLGNYVFEQCEKNKVKVLGFIDSNPNKQESQIRGVSVYAPTSADTAKLVIISNLFWYDVQEQLIKLGFENWLYYEELALLDCGFPIFYQAFEGMYVDLHENKEHYLNVFNLLEDEKSKEIYENILMFRQTMDVNYTKRAYDLSICDGKQYFDRNIVTPTCDEVFVDGGGNKGETSIDFIEWAGETYKGVYIFEPDTELMEEARKNLCKWKNVTYYNYGIGGEFQKLYFTHRGDGGGSFSDKGDEIVQVVSLDETIIERVTFIKFDIEGSEREALQGAVMMIMRDKPRLAISAYHKCNDIYRLIDFIRTIRSDYKIYMRHYTNVYADTVLYFV